MIISLIHEKGGVGKTTLAINIAAAFKWLNKSSVLLVDADPQGSARDWHTNNDGTVLDVLGIDRPTIDKDLQKISRQYDYVIVDSAPRLSTLTTKLILSSDIILIPATPSPYDVWACPALVELIKQRQDITDGKPKAAFIINRRIKNTNIGKELSQTLENYGLPVFKNGAHQRIVYAESAASGKTVIGNDAAHNEIIQIVKELEDFIHVDS